jgi:hypothetical protein
MLKGVGRAEEKFIYETIKSSTSYGSYYNTNYENRTLAERKDTG